MILKIVVAVISFLGIGSTVAYAQSSLSTSTVDTIVTGMLGDIVSIFTDNIGVVLTFAVSFMVLALLLALGRRFFRL